jgi:hypothetical protein
MSALVSGSTLSEAWVRTFDLVRRAPGGRLPHVITAVRDPGTEVLEVRDELDKLLSDRGSQSIMTVAETIFPSSLYYDPGIDWHPGMDQAAEALLDDAAGALYESYTGMLPILRTVNANKSGTYFSRMVTWPGKRAGGTNQLERRIARLRSEAEAGRRTNNTLDIDLAADALDVELPISGVQVYAVTDERTRGFPCLTHIDLTLHEGRLHCTAVYRHQYLVEKAYGNLVGLSALLLFLCQQGGCDPGELVVHATMADAQTPKFGQAAAAQVVDGALAAIDAVPSEA